MRPSRDKLSLFLFPLTVDQEHSAAGQAAERQPQAGDVAGNRGFGQRNRLVGNIRFFVQITAVFAVAMLLGSVSSGNTYASEFLYGLAVGYTSLFLISSFFDKKSVFSLFRFKSTNR